MLDESEDHGTSGGDGAAEGRQDEDDEEEESDEEDKHNRGRFKSERSDTTKIKRERANIPDTLGQFCRSQPALPLWSKR